MPSEPMSNAPFPIPPDSPWFHDLDGEPVFIIGNEDAPMYLFRDYASWPPCKQAEAAAVAAMEWEQASALPTIGLTFGQKGVDAYYAAREGFYTAQDAFVTARERMRGDGHEAESR